MEGLETNIMDKTWEHSGMTCLLRHGVYNAPCGYVVLDESHPLHGSGLNDLYDTPLVENIDVHGGITFAGKLDDGRWAIGFDMAHYSDFHTIDYEQCIRTDEECIAETNRFAEQLKNLR